ncbi:MAG: hypothetical protein FD127_2065 [Acidimicrobiaceae bacterium]|nr:MAG: hypothetical protein FD127_2065 [Acidimicrobiaceae bacterium]
MRIRYQVVAFDAADIGAESAFWAGVLGGEVDRDDGWHMVTVKGEPLDAPPVLRDARLGSRARTDPYRRISERKCSRGSVSSTCGC